MLSKYGNKAFERTKRSPVNHYRTVALVVSPDVFQLKAFRQVVVHLNRSELPFSAQSIFHLIAAYSPKLNLVEQAIYLIRQKILHHTNCKTDLAHFESYMKKLCRKEKSLNKEQIINTSEHVKSLVIHF